MMSEQQFDTRIKEIESECASMRERVDEHRDQEVARLFVEAKQSGRNQKWIAARMGQAESWVSQRLLFGRFLEIHGREFLKSVPKPLTEWRFRQNWKASGKKTHKKETEEERFDRVLELLKADTSDVPRYYKNLAKKPGIKAAVVKIISDGKRRTTAEIAEIISETIPGTHANQVIESIKLIRKDPPKGMALDERHTGQSHRYRLVERKRNHQPSTPIDPEKAGAIAAEVMPLIKDCIEIMKKPAVGRSQTLALENLGRIEKALSRLLVMEAVM